MTGWRLGWVQASARMVKTMSSAAEFITSNPPAMVQQAGIVALRDGEPVAVERLVICRQRPGTAKGFIFLSLEDETGIVNVVVTPQRFERQALLISRTPLLLVRGVLQVEQKVVNVRAKQFRALQAAVGAEFAQRHDFH